MLAIRMQRTGRKGHAMFRVVVQDSRVTPTSGKVVAQIGHYDPHTKAATIDKDKASLFLSNGAQPSDRVARLLKSQGVDLPEWVSLNDSDRSRTIRNSDKLRKNQPKEEKTEEVTVEAPAAEEPTVDAPTEETPAEVTEAPAEEKVEEVAESNEDEAKEEDKKEA